MHRLIIHSRHLRNANLPNWKKSISRLIGNFTQIWPKYLLINISAPLRLVSDFPQLLFHFLRQRSLWARSCWILCYTFIEKVTMTQCANVYMTDFYERKIKISCQAQVRFVTGLSNVMVRNDPESFKTSLIEAISLMSTREKYEVYPRVWRTRYP